MPGPTMIGVAFSSVPPSHVPLPSRRRLQTQELPLSERQLPQSRNRNSKRAGRLSATGGKYSFRPVLCMLQVHGGRQPSGPELLSFKTRYSRGRNAGGAGVGLASCTFLCQRGQSNFGAPLSPKLILGRLVT